MKRSSITLLALVASLALPGICLAQAESAPSGSGVAQQFKDGGNSLGHGISQGATQIGHGFENGAILTWDAMKNGAHSVANTFSGNDDRSQN